MRGIHALREVGVFQYRQTTVYLSVAINFLLTVHNVKEELFACYLFVEIQKKHEQLTRKEEGRAKFSEKLSSLISEQLQKGISFKL